ncbi:unnamed protein product [Timema podura]|uniref:Uncharacterized protein n=1 Tax=Timema podura TaxID=61482 RepID=A0ABN7NIR0_TIMPD|nr:unnamed protein product [Timema podura]
MFELVTYGVKFAAGDPVQGRVASQNPSSRAAPAFVVFMNGKEDLDSKGCANAESLYHRAKILYLYVTMQPSSRVLTLDPLW